MNTHIENINQSIKELLDNIKNINSLISNINSIANPADFLDKYIQCFGGKISIQTDETFVWAFFKEKSEDKILITVRVVRSGNLKQDKIFLKNDLIFDMMDYYTGVDISLNHENSLIKKKTEYLRKYDPSQRDEFLEMIMKDYQRQLFKLYLKTGKDSITILKELSDKMGCVIDDSYDYLNHTEITSIKGSKECIYSLAISSQDQEILYKSQSYSKKGKKDAKKIAADMLLDVVF